MVMVLQDLQKRRGNKITAQSAGIVVVYMYQTRYNFGQNSEFNSRSLEAFEQHYLKDDDAASLVKSFIAFTKEVNDVAMEQHSKYFL